LCVALVTVLLAGTAACSGGPSEPPSSGKASEATTESSAPASSSAEETPAYCWGLATFDDEVQEFQEAALVGDIIGEPTDPDELAAEADRLAQSASDLSGEAPESIAAASRRCRRVADRSPRWPAGRRRTEHRGECDGGPGTFRRV
jgi:hypothetical protein